MKKSLNDLKIGIYRYYRPTASLQGLRAEGTGVFLRYDLRNLSNVEIRQFFST